MKKVSQCMARLACNLFRRVNPSRSMYTSTNLVRGIDFLEDCSLNKGLAFSKEEREVLGLQGLLPPNICSIEEQIKISQLEYDSLPDNLSKYFYLTELEENNERLFYNFISSDIEKYMPILYGPTVAHACQNLGLIYRRPRGLFISANDMGHIAQILRNWPNSNVKTVIFTDGEQTFGTGDQGVNGMAIPVGKLSLFTALGRIYPEDTLPIVLDCGTDNQKLLSDPLYPGLRQERIKGEQYDNFIDEFVKACGEVFGETCLLQFEDFSVWNGARFLDKYKTQYCTYNDDIQGTGAVVLSGIMSASKISKKKLSENRYMFFGANSAAVGIAHLLVQAMVEEGLAKSEAYEQIFMYDAGGFLSSRRQHAIPEHAMNFVRDALPDSRFTYRSVARSGANVFIGCSSIRGAFSPDILSQMAKNCERPVIFTLSDRPTEAECSAQEAYDNTEGRCIFSSRSHLFPFASYEGKKYQIGQACNAYIFPGLVLGVTAINSSRITDSMLMTAAQTVSDLVTTKDLQAGRIYPPKRFLKDIAMTVAENVAKFCYKQNYAAKYPEPESLNNYLEESVYNLDYNNYLPKQLYYPADKDEHSEFDQISSNDFFPIF